MSYVYSENEYQESKITIPQGKYRARISQIIPKISKKGSPMYEITLDISGFSYRVKDYLVFMEDNTKMTNAKVGAIIHAFGVSAIGINPAEKPAGWEGAVGACFIKPDEEGRPKVSYYIEKEKSTDLPPWKEPERKLGFGNSDASMFSAPVPQTAPPANVGMSLPPVDDEDLPFTL